MIRVTLSIIFVSYLGRVPTYAVPYFILSLVLISVIMAGLGIRRGYLHYYDIFNLIVFPTIFVIYIMFPEKVLPWMIHSWGPIIYLLLAVVKIAPSLLLRRPVECISWKKESSPAPIVLLVLWGTTFLLSSTMLWLHAPVRTPWLIIAILTVPTRIAVVRELKLIRSVSYKRANIQQVKFENDFSSSFNGDEIAPTYNLKHFLQLSEQKQYRQMSEWLTSIARSEEEKRQQGIRQLLLAIARLNDVDRAKVIKVRTIVLARMPAEQIRDIVRSRYQAMKELRDIDEADRSIVMMMSQDMPGDVQQVITKVSTKLREEFSKRKPK